MTEDNLTGRRADHPYLDGCCTLPRERHPDVEVMKTVSADGSVKSIEVVENTPNKTVTTVTEGPPPVKPGYLTSEFYISLTVMVLGALWGSGIFGEGTSIDRALGIAAMALAPFGYTLSRGAAKRQVSK